jgi:hypothetical protein
MRITHRISLICTRQIRRELAAMGIDVSAEHDRLLLTFEVDESFAEWTALSKWIRKWDAVDVIYTEFSDDEVVAARWLGLSSTSQSGYPQPRDSDFGYLEVSYDLTDYCEACGVGLKQKAALRMKAEPRWGRREMMQLNWIMGEYFVKPDIWARVFKPRGIECRAVANSRGVELKTVVQLVVNEEVGVRTKGLSGDRCRKCRRTKFSYPKSGPFPSLEAEPSGPIARTKQYFGSGGAADQWILVSRDLAGDMRAEAIRGVSFHPVKN